MYIKTCMRSLLVLSNKHSTRPEFSSMFLQYMQGTGQPVVVPAPWWGLLNRTWIMAAAAHFIWSLLPQIFLLFPDRHTGIGTGGGGGALENITSGAPLSSLIHRPFSEEQRLLMREEARRMFYWGYDHYMKHAFPDDELNPIRCQGRGHDWDDLTNTNVNDALGDYSLTLVDSLDTLVIMGNASEFRRAAQLVVDHVMFDRCTTVQVFEATIRVMGSLLSAYLLTQSTLNSSPFSLSPPLPPDDPIPERLLELAHDLAIRLLPAFEDTATGIPHPRVNLCTGVPVDGSTETCTAGAGTLSVEFTLLSRLVGDPTYERLARRAVRALWDRRHPITGLVGNVINIHSGQWTGRMSGLGAGVDSFYEYLMKSYILFGEKEDLEMFSQMYASVMKYLRRGRSCRDVFEDTALHSTPYFVNVDYSTARTLNYWMDALSASFAGVQVLAGDLEEAICTHAVYYSIWRRYGALPERFDWNTKTPNVRFYPLRPELVESTYLLYQATQNPFYLHVGSDILNSLDKYTKTSCGYATLHDVTTKTKEDRMESFFLSETCKYLYLLFDTENAVNRYSSQFVFTTEGHVLQLDPALRHRPWDQDGHNCFKDNKHAVARINESFVSHSCPVYEHNKRYALPLSRQRLGEIEALVGLDTSKETGR